MSADTTFVSRKTEESVSEYAGFGGPEDTQARIRLLDWIQEQLGNGSVRAEAGDYVLATDGRILGMGKDSEVLYHQLVAAEPHLETVRLVGYCVPPSEY